MGKNEKGKKISITIPSELSYSPKVREFVTNFLKKESSFSNKWISRLVLMTDEMVNNAIEHGSNNTSDTIEVNIILNVNKNLEIKIIDTGKVGNILTADTLMDKVLENAEKAKKDIRFNTTVRGRGLCQIVKSWSDNFYYLDNKEGGLTGILEKEYNDSCKKVEELIKENKKEVSKKKIVIETFTF